MNNTVNDETPMADPRPYVIHTRDGKFRSFSAMPGENSEFSPRNEYSQNEEDPSTARGSNG